MRTLKWIQWHTNLHTRTRTHKHAHTQVTYKEFASAMKAAHRGGVGLDLAEKLEVRMILQRMGLMMIMKVRAVIP